MVVADSLDPEPAIGLMDQLVRRRAPRVNHIDRTDLVAPGIDRAPQKDDLEQVYLTNIKNEIPAT